MSFLLAIPRSIQDLMAFKNDRSSGGHSVLIFLEAPVITISLVSMVDLISIHFSAGEIYLCQHLVSFWPLRRCFQTKCLRQENMCLLLGSF